MAFRRWTVFSILASLAGIVWLSLLSDFGFFPVSRLGGVSSADLAEFAALNSTLRQYWESTGNVSARIENAERRLLGLLKTAADRGRDQTSLGRLADALAVMRAEVLWLKTSDKEIVPEVNKPKPPERGPGARVQAPALPGEPTPAAKDPEPVEKVEGIPVSRTDNVLGRSRTVMIKSYLDNYLSVAVAGIVVAMETGLSEKSQFKLLINDDDGSISLESVYRGSYVSVDSAGRVIANGQEITNAQRLGVITNGGDSELELEPGTMVLTHRGKVLTVLPGGKVRAERNNGVDRRHKLEVFDID